MLTVPQVRTEIAEPSTRRGVGLGHMLRPYTGTFRKHGLAWELAMSLPGVMCFKGARCCKWDGSRCIFGDLVVLILLGRASPEGQPCHLLTLMPN